MGNDDIESLIEEINNFNAMYYSYLNCANGKVTCSNYDEYGSPANATVFGNRVNSSYIQLQSKINAYNSSIGSIIDFDEYDASYNSIITTNLENVKNRLELDMQIKELQNAHDSVYSEDKQQRDITIYMNITLTALITCGVFYVFSNL